MMNSYSLPYGNSSIDFLIESDKLVDLLLPNKVLTKLSGSELVRNALNNPLNGVNGFNNLHAGSKIVITINDKTRPVPNTVLLPPLLEMLSNVGVRQQNIRILIASGTHILMKPEEFCQILDKEIISKYQIYAHDCDDSSNLLFLGETSSGTPVYVNKYFYEADLRIVVGDIEPHHFAGYSGGVKSASIGLCGRTTINTNHMHLLDQRSTVGRYDDNPLRMDIEEIGRIIQVDLSLNAVLDEKKKILGVFFGKPVDVMREGIKLVNSICQVPVPYKYDLVIASAGGYPKDINLYQSQKAMTHASLFCKKGGTILLAAECREGVGSDGYVNFMKDLKTIEEIKMKFSKQGFSVGPHKAIQIARIIENHNVLLHSSMPDELVKSLLLCPVELDHTYLSKLIENIPQASRIAILPYATACIPTLQLED